ncbi:hypothetical protein D0809_01530 [Flavobacterium circumlabens]|uniref:Lipoprotein n=1 Tax=Flavobacterium circumlabens TaxID=2133765 RepID=A0A4Y7UGY0_9FLAO|nr:hypothetical protein [Flavobacterium circumlabens]TCN60557.1 hypothetical protein EV142_101127 [Flavobacterium circumlabens]TEB45715.1 hypothetical protein D0809_01530 [Flavobacterium circumlabens]
MKKIIAILLLSIACFFTGCGDDAKKQAKQETVYPVNKLNPAPVKILKKATPKTTLISNSKKRALAEKKNIFSVKAEHDFEPQIKNQQIIANSPKLDLSEEANKTLMTFVNLRKILYGSKIGQTLTQEELTQKFEIPEEAVKLVKSITKTDDDEIAVKWRSTWLVEKISDAKFRDGLMKITFKANKLYTSGTAIGIKYDKKIYNELVIIGRSAYIPGVKGYSWQIGK